MERVLERSVESSFETQLNMKNDLISCLKEFLENEARSYSMDFGCVTPLYVYRMWGGGVKIEDITSALEAVKKEIW